MVEELSHILEKAIFLKAKELILVAQGQKKPFTERAQFSRRVFLWTWYLEPPQGEELIYLLLLSTKGTDQAQSAARGPLVVLRPAFPPHLQ